MSTVNLTEVLGRLARDGRALDEALDHQQMGIVWIDFDRDSPLGAALLPGSRLACRPGTVHVSRSPGCAISPPSPPIALGRRSISAASRSYASLSRVAAGEVHAIGLGHERNAA
jgi:hypothetical protein